MPIERGDRDLTGPHQLRENLWKPAVVPYAEGQTNSRLMRTDNGADAITSGTLQLHGGAVIRQGQAYKGITFYSGNTAFTPGTNQWFCLVSAIDRAVLVKTADDGATAWLANNAKSLLFASQFIATADLPVYLGIVVVGGTPPNLRSVGADNSVLPKTAPPAISGSSTAGLTDPASLGGTAAALTVNLNWCAYAHLV